MSAPKPIKSALVSVFHKEGLDRILALLNAAGVKFISTGGTRSFIEGLGYSCDAVEDLTGYPSILGGRVKTLHPKVFGGILGRRELADDVKQMGQFSIPDIDLVIVDLYPFVDTVASGASQQDIIEKIDIGGISLIRAAAKNFNDVVIVASKAQYEPLRAILESQGAETTLEQRRAFARDAFAVSSGYDSAIFNWFDSTNSDGPTALRFAVDGMIPMRYGENPHQKGFFAGRLDDYFDKLHGKEISYNNLLDIDAAVSLMSEFAGDEPTFAVLKHNNACGLATRATVAEAWRDALAGDPVSAFGGVLICNREIDSEAAAEIDKIFFEVIIAPGYTPAALELLEKKKNRIILVQKSNDLSKIQVRTCLNGALVQERDLHAEKTAELEPMTKLAPTETQIDDMLFANKIVKHSKSNAIVLAKNRMLLGSGVGQTSRVDALRHAIEKANAFELSLEGAAMASDAFFPFADCVEIAAAAGVRAIIQPGGSIRDGESVEWCDNHGGIAMVKTGYRHFKH